MLMDALKKTESLIGLETVRFFDNYIARTAGTVISELFRDGENAAKDELNFAGAQYSAILDDKTCAYCAMLDGMTVRFDEEGNELYEKYSPAQHPNCRCFWVYIGADEKFKDDNKDFEKSLSPEIVGEQIGYTAKNRWHLWAGSEYGDELALEFENESEIKKEQIENNFDDWIKPFTDSDLPF